MPQRSRTQLKAWFRRGKYPTEEQFADWHDSYVHKAEDTIPIAHVDGLPAQLNGKYPATEGAELERRHDALESDYNKHKAASTVQFNNIADNIEELEAEDERQQGEIDALGVQITNIHKKDAEQDKDFDQLQDTTQGLAVNMLAVMANFTRVRAMLKAGATLDEAKAALAALGDNYASLYSLASTVKTFLESTDTKDTTINTWQEIEAFLQGVTDTETLTGLLKQSEDKLTGICNNLGEAIRDVQYQTSNTFRQRPFVNANEVYDNSDPMDLSTAIGQLPDELHRTAGCVVTFRADEKGTWKTYQWQPPGMLWEESMEDAEVEAAWLDKTNWKECGVAMLSVTYAELVTLRDSGELRPGTYYRITDYETTVANDPEARSAGHVFDLIVLATAPGMLSEEAMAIKSPDRDPDDYFATAKLEAWKVWYCLDNDTTRFQWANTENGKGVIYRLIDEWGNDCPYDFKNIQFKRYRVTDDCLSGELATLDGLYLGYDGELQDLDVIEQDYIWAYTFSLGDMLGAPDDASNCGFNGSGIGAGYSAKGFYGDNVILPCSCRVTRDEEQSYSVFCLNNIVIYANNNQFSCLLSGNRIGSECLNMTISGYDNNISHDCRNIITGDICYANNFETGCGLITFRNGCRHNTFGSDCYHNTFGSGCGYNTFGSDLRNIILNGCVDFVAVTGGASSDSHVHYAQVLNGTHGIDTQHRLQITFTANVDYCQFAGLNSAGELKIWTPADII